MNTATSPIIIYGAGGHAKVVLDTALEIGMEVAYLVDDITRSDALLGVRIVNSSSAEWLGERTFRFVVAIGDNTARAKVFQQLLERGGTPVSAIHPSAVVSKNACIGSGTVVCAGAIVNPGAVIKANCILNTGCSIDHDCRIEEHVHICPGAHLAGGIEIAQGTMIGIGTSITPGLKIGCWTKVGAGSVVVRDIPGHVVAYGTPARVVREISQNSSS